MIVRYSELFEERWAERSKKGLSKYSIEPKEFMDILIDRINREGKNKYRFCGLIPNMKTKDGVVLSFSKDAYKWKYDYIIPHEVNKYVNLCEKSGRIPVDEEVNKIYESYGDIHCSVIIPNINKINPILFIAEKIDIKPENYIDKSNIYDNYESANPGRKALNVKGNETKGFLEWIKNEQDT